jgi:hypothetical protein
LLSCVEAIDKADNDKEDLKIMAKSVGAILKKRSSTWIDDEPKEKVKRPPPNNSGRKTEAEEGKTSTSNASSAAPQVGPGKRQTVTNSPLLLT